MPFDGPEIRTKVSSNVPRGSAGLELDAAAKLNAKSGRIRLALANAYRSLDRKDEAARELRLFQHFQGQEQPD